MTQAPSDTDISGNWTGFYSYPDAVAPPCRFDAVLLDRGGQVTGTIEEVDELLGSGHLIATVDGARTGQRVRFTKFYENGDEGFDTVQYDGQLDAEGTEISGDWHIPGEWSGSFIMTRETGAKAAVAVERSVTVD